MTTRYFEDFEIGESQEFGTYHVTEAEIVEFAEKYDPQAFHVDPAAATDSIYGGLIASGWHTCSMTMRLLVDNLLSETAILGATGVDDLRWRAPVRPGDDLSVSIEVVDTEPAASRRDRGLVKTAIEVTNQDDDEVLSFIALALFARRDGG